MDFTEAYPDTTSPVALAARTGDLNKLRRLVSRGKSTEIQDNRGWRAIHEAAFWGQTECLNFLLQQSNAHVNAYTFEGQTALWLAADNNCFEAARILIENGGQVNLPNCEDVTPLHCAASKGFKRMAELLIENGANIDLPDYGMYTPLHEAALQGHSSVVELLLANGAENSSQDSRGRTPLFCGAQSHNCEVVKYLLEGTTPSLINLRAHDGGTAIMLAAQSGCLGCVQLLVTNGADPNLKANDGVMAVHLALTSNNEGLLRFLLGITDHSFIEQSCAIGLHNHPQSSIREPHWNRSNAEAINIFQLAVTYDKLQLIEVLIEEGLCPDFFPCPLYSTNAANWSTLQKVGFKWLTPLSFILAHSPFTTVSLEIVKLLISKGSSTKAIQPEFLPPVFAIATLAKWENVNEQPFLIDALDLLVKEKGVLRIPAAELFDVLRFALYCKPIAFQHLLHYGYIIKDSIFKDTSKKITDAGPLQPTHFAALSALRSAGFLIAVDLSADESQGKIRTLKQLARNAIHNQLQLHEVRSPMPELNLPLPDLLIKYLCYNDVTF